MNDTWDKVMAMKPKDTRHKGLANGLTQDEIETILATSDFFGANVKQNYFDLVVAKYRVFDWLAMSVMSNRMDSTDATKVFAHSLLKVDGDIDKFIQDLRETDYDIDHSWEAIQLEGTE